MARLGPRRRPYYSPAERMAILELKAARGRSLAQTANALLVQPATIASWVKRIDEEGDAALVRLREPVNKFPDFIRYIVQSLKALCPSLGKREIGQILARAAASGWAQYRQAGGLQAARLQRLRSSPTPCPRSAAAAASCR